MRRSVLRAALVLSLLVAAIVASAAADVPLAGSAFASEEAGSSPSVISPDAGGARKQTTLTVLSGPATVTYPSASVMTSRLSVNGVALPGETVGLWASTNRGVTWSRVATATEIEPGIYRGAARLSSGANLQMRYEGRPPYRGSIQDQVVYASVRAALGTPVLNVAAPRSSTAFRVSGSIGPRHASESRVTLMFYRYLFHRYMLYKTVSVPVAAHGNSYGLTYRLPAGAWCVKTKHLDSGHAVNVSPPKYFRVAAY